jgi:hypothetical protein
MHTHVCVCVHARAYSSVGFRLGISRAPQHIDCIYGESVK